MQELALLDVSYISESEKMKNSENNLDRLIKKHLHLKKKIPNIEELPLGQDCPSELELNDYLENRLSQQRENLVLEHIADCPHCLSLLELSQEATKEKVKDRPTPEMIMRVKKIVRQKSAKAIFNYKWPILAAVSFTLSFIWGRYFLQFLILAIIFSVKWIFDSGSTRTLIMIYEAWRGKDKSSAQRIIQDFQDKIEQSR